jgi:GxxExxY protein
MPIRCSQQFEWIEEDEFRALDYRVMGYAFAIHNDLGPVFNEKVYQHALAASCARGGFDVQTELPIAVEFGSFKKLLYIDLIVEGKTIYELKTATTLTPAHYTQALNYLLLAGGRHGKLVNFRPNSVEHKFVSTTLTDEERRRLTYSMDRWNSIDSDSRWFKDIVIELLDDWGGFLDIQLLYDAICHFRDGEEQVIQPIEVHHNGCSLGTQRAHLLSPTVAFKISAVTKDVVGYEKHLRRLLAHTTLTSIQWVNLDHHTVRFVTLSK